MIEAVSNVVLTGTATLKEPSLPTVVRHESKHARIINEISSSDEDFDDNCSRGKVVGLKVEQSNTDKSMTTICLMKVPPQLDDSGQERFCDSTNEFHYLDSSTTDARLITNCRTAPLDASKHDPAVENKETETESGAGNLHMKKAKFESDAPTRTQLVALVISIEEEIRTMTKARKPLSILLSPALMLKTIITEPLLDGLTGKCSSNTSIIRNETGCAFNVNTVKEEHPRRQLLHEFKLMNSENLLLNFDPGGKWLNEPSEDDGQNQSRVVNMEGQSPWILFDRFVYSHVRPVTAFGLMADHELYLCLQLGNPIDSLCSL